MSEFQKKLTEGFLNLRARGYYARQNWKCCMNCGCAAVPKRYADSYVFYHAQDFARMKEVLEPYVMLAWAGDGHEICKALLEAGLATEWNGESSRRIKVCLPVIN